MDLPTARQRAVSSPLARLGTVTPDGKPHLVPCCFALSGEVAYTAVDGKPKSTPWLRRVQNLLVHPAACLLVDHYDDDWTALWWVRMDGLARLVQSQAESNRAQELLLAKYDQYATVALDGPLIGIDIERWVSWP
ncbi:MAG: TIGR03668 family PPOX class F420-dependent oxidoreductase [Acidimicrobiales bacterium]|nr:TIGR03668 family PPOX class F420-dependent oxidoreductase [Acidimicrobiales bacterium]